MRCMHTIIQMSYPKITEQCEYCMYAQSDPHKDVQFCQGAQPVGTARNRITQIISQTIDDISVFQTNNSESK